MFYEDIPNYNDYICTAFIVCFFFFRIFHNDCFSFVGGLKKDSKETCSKKLRKKKKKQTKKAEQKKT